ncbi:MAG TPA: ATP-binding protein [Candidatus Dormibacteraeota bacterium]|nr:ATP-binding protein [Candidatus Dormibacteraeota bacterium]
MRFPVWRKKRKKEEVAPTAASVSRRAIAGAGVEDLAVAALQIFQQSSGADRLGVWLESPEDMRGAHEPSFHGFVWDRQNSSTPLECSRLAPQSPLPAAVLSGEKSMSVDIESMPGQSMIAPLIGMQRALWVPVTTNGVLRGLLLAANKNRSRKLLFAPSQTVAAELGLALEHQHEKHQSERLQADSKLVAQLLRNIATAEACGNALDMLVKDAVEPKNELAQFVFIQKLSSALGNLASIDEFHWGSGESIWTTTLRREPFLGLWRNALIALQTIDTTLPVSWRRGNVKRIIAVPLKDGQELLGVLVAGFSQNTFAVFERIQLRALLAARVLADLNRFARESRNEQRRQSILLAGSEALILLDSHSRVVDASSAARKLLGEKTNHSPSPVPDEDLLPNLFRDHDQERLKIWLQNSRDDVTGARHKSIEAVLLSGAAVRLSAAPQATAEFIALRCEILEPAKDTAESLHAEQELQVVLGWLEEGVIVFDAHENIRAMNERFTQIAGIPPHEAAALTTLDELIKIISPRVTEPKHFARTWLELSGMDGDVREEMEIASPSPCLLERTSRAIVDSAGRRAGRVEIYRDLTARRLLQTKLLRTERLAEVGQRVSSVAHELSNPLTTILGYAQRLLMRAEISPPANEIRQIFHEADRAGKILRQLLPSSRQPKQLHRRKVSVNRVVVQTVEMQRNGDGWGTIRTELDLDPLGPTVWGDAGELQQVLINLLSNARHAIAETGTDGLIRIRTRQFGGNTVTLEVTDNGPGIPEKIAARIFDPFFTTRQAGLGTGLGLSIVLGIIREHGGQMSVISPPTGGTKFSIELRSTPIVSSRAQIPASSDAREFSPSWGKPVHRNRSGVHAHVLVVEDEPTVARLIADVLEDQGYNVDVMLSSREALERAGNSHYDLAICDMRMPGLDGQHFFQALLLAQNPLREKLLFVTGDGVAPATREFLERNKLPYVAKPFRVEELSEAVTKILARTLRIPAEENNPVRKLGANNA